MPRKKQTSKREFETEIKNLELMNFMTPGQIYHKELNLVVLRLVILERKLDYIIQWFKSK